LGDLPAFTLAGRKLTRRGTVVFSKTTPGRIGGKKLANRKKIGPRVLAQAEVKKRRKRLTPGR